MTSVHQVRHVRSPYHPVKHPHPNIFSGVSNLAYQYGDIGANSNNLLNISILG
jgi:hypothetical protein